MSDLCRARLKIFGRVQGVFYRQTTRDTARALGLSGWVANMPDGTVEAEAIGRKDLVEQLIAWCWQGPPSASVSDVRVEWLEVDNAPARARFEIR
ncbi:MAG TPA: acylphosphatase [Candidatus Obscuribacterales bacterium]